MKATNAETPEERQRKCALLYVFPSQTLSFFKLFGNPSFPAPRPRISSGTERQTTTTVLYMEPQFPKDTEVKHHYLLYPNRGRLCLHHRSICRPDACSSETVLVSGVRSHLLACQEIPRTLHHLLQANWGHGHTGLPFGPSHTAT